MRMLVQLLPASAPVGSVNNAGNGPGSPSFPLPTVAGTAVRAIMVASPPKPAKLAARTLKEYVSPDISPGTRYTKTIGGTLVREANASKPLKAEKAFSLDTVDSVNSAGDDSGT
jgi:hypothetical protein